MKFSAVRERKLPKNIDLFIATRYTINNARCAQDYAYIQFGFAKYDERKRFDMVFDKIKEIILDQMDVDEEDITPDADIQDDLHADSLDIVMLMKTISDEFEMAVPDDAVDSIKTVGDIVDYIENYQ